MRPLLLLALAGCGYITEAELLARFDLDGDGVPRPADCDDGDAQVGAVLRFVDQDGDGYGGEETVEACRDAIGLAEVGGDCDDGEPRVHPDGTPWCDLRDADCDNLVDEAGWFDATAWYPDEDRDGAGAAGAVATLACTSPEGSWATNDNDCDDDNKLVRQLRWFRDADEDGYGDAFREVSACAQPGGFVADDGDCDDDNADIHPGVPERCGGADEDCDVLTDDADPDVIDQRWWYEDADGDALGDLQIASFGCFADPAVVADPIDNALDCDDSDIRVGAAEASQPCPLRAVAAGGALSCALGTDGALSCWGEPALAALTPTSGAFLSVGVGQEHVCAVTAERALVCWGPEADDLPDLALLDAPVDAVSVDGYHTCAHRLDGGAMCWGDEVTYTLNPVDGGYASVTAGTTHACALRASDGAAVCVGVCTDEGECADHEEARFSAVVAGNGYSCAESAAGLTCWGQLRDADPTFPLYPRALDAWGPNLCAVTPLGLLVCRGALMPAGLADVPPGRFSTVAVGAAHACALTEEAPPALVCWGENSAGQASPP